MYNLKTIAAKYEIEVTGLFPKLMKFIFTMFIKMKRRDLFYHQVKEENYIPQK